MHQSLHQPQLVLNTAAQWCKPFVFDDTPVIQLPPVLSPIAEPRRRPLPDPPVAWLIPLIGDAVIGVTGLWIVYLIMKKTGLWVWTTILIWNAVAIWDALSAYIVHKTVPWPDFFMTEIFGSSMFFVAALMHSAIIVLLNQREIKSHYLVVN